MLVYKRKVCIGHYDLHRITNSKQKGISKPLESHGTKKQPLQQLFQNMSSVHSAPTKHATCDKAQIPKNNYFRVLGSTNTKLIKENTKTKNSLATRLSKQLNIFHRFSQTLSIDSVYKLFSFLISLFEVQSSPLLQINTFSFFFFSLSTSGPKLGYPHPIPPIAIFNSACKPHMIKSPPSKHHLLYSKYGHIIQIHCKPLLLMLPI